ncbi:MAG: hypothetical protein RR338_06215, partial [Clostridia bacterium]
AKKKNVCTVDCTRLDDQSIGTEVGVLLSENPPRTIDPSALNELIKRTLGNMSRIACEVQKLKAYSDGNITRDDVCELVTPELDFQIFEISQAVSEKNATKALTVLDSFAKNSVRSMTVINLLFGHYRKMLHVEVHKNDTDADLAELLGVKSGALYHIKKVSKNYSQVRLKKCVDFLHEMQCAVLSGKRQEATALHEAILTLLNI